MGQPALAASAICWTLARSAPGTLAVTSRCEAVTENPPSDLSRVTVAVASMDLGVMLALPSSAEKAMAKQPAWAAAMSSSGLVPTPFSKRVPKEYWVCLRTPLSLEMVPLPSLSPPFQMADALRLIIIIVLLSLPNS